MRIKTAALVGLLAIGLTVVVPAGAFGTPDRTATATEDAVQLVAANEEPPENAKNQSDDDQGPSNGSDPGDARNRSDDDRGPPNGADPGNGKNQSDDDQGPPNGTDPGNESDSGGQDDGMPEGVESFVATTPLGPDRVEPASLAGKLRVEDEYAENTTVELVRNTSEEYSLAITIPNATNVTFYLNTEAIEESQNVTNVTAQVDGEVIATGLTERSNGPWIGFEIDHFSTRTVTFTTESAQRPPNEDVERFDQDNNGVVDFEDILNVIQALNNGQMIGGEPVDFQDVIKAIDAFNDANQ